MTVKELEEQVAALTIRMDAMMRDNEASFQQIHAMLQPLIDRKAVLPIPDRPQSFLVGSIKVPLYGDNLNRSNERHRMEIPEMPLWNNLHHTDEEYFKEEKKNRPDLSGWSWMPLERDAPLSSPNKFRSIIFCAVNGTHRPPSHSFSWYSIDFKENRNSSSLASTVCPRQDCGTTLSPVFSNMPRTVPRFFVAVALGTRIYAIGGCGGHRLEQWNYSDVFYFDVVHPEQGWKEGPSMLTARYKLSAVVVDSKIYVFGGVESSGMLFAEVLDPVSDTWVALPQPTFLLPDFVAPVHALLSDNKKERRLLFHPFDLDALYSYNLDTGVWEMFDKYFGRICFEDTSTAVDGVLYCYFYELYPDVYAYDLLKRKWFSKPLRGLPREDMPLHHDRPVSLFHIGGDRLCLFWSAFSPDGRREISQVEQTASLVVAICTIFTVQKDYTLHSEEPDLLANIESVTRHYAEGKHCACCIAL